MTELHNQLETIRMTVEQHASKMGKPPFDSPLRTKRYVEDENGIREIQAGEWGKFEWYNVTSLNSPGDGHVYVRGWAIR